MLASIVISLDGTGKALRRTIASFRTGTLHDIRHKVLLWKGSFGYMPIFFTCVRKMHAEGRKGILISSSLINVRRESLVKTTRRFHNSALMLLSSLRLLSDGMQCSTTSWPLWTWIDIRTTTPSDADLPDDLHKYRSGFSLRPHLMVWISSEKHQIYSLHPSTSMSPKVIASTWRKAFKPRQQILQNINPKLTWVIIGCRRSIDANPISTSRRQFDSPTSTSMNLDLAVISCLSYIVSMSELVMSKVRSRCDLCSNKWLPVYECDKKKPATSI